MIETSKVKKGTYQKDGVYYRVCGFCKKHKSLDNTNFHSDKGRTLGFMYECKECSSLRIDLRKGRWRSMSEEKKNKIRSKNRVYRASEIGRASQLAYAYKKSDKAKGQKCDIDKTFILENIFSKACTYCGDIEDARGCDRIDNHKGHTKDNVVPCCKTCNTARMHNFSHEEMKILGEAIAKVKALRKNNSSL